jgi:hypothetical protein
MLNNINVICHSPSWSGQIDIKLRRLMFIKSYDSLITTHVQQFFILYSVQKTQNSFETY